MNARDMLAFKIGLQAGIDQGRRVGFMNGHRAGTNSLYEAAVAMGAPAAPSWPRTALARAADDAAAGVAAH